MIRQSMQVSGIFVAAFAPCVGTGWAQQTSKQETKYQRQYVGPDTTRVVQAEFRKGVIQAGLRNGDPQQRCPGADCHPANSGWRTLVRGTGPHTASAGSHRTTRDVTAGRGSGRSDYSRDTAGAAGEDASYGTIRVGAETVKMCKSSTPGRRWLMRPSPDNP